MKYILLEKIWVLLFFKFYIIYIYIYIYIYITVFKHVFYKHVGFGFGFFLFQQLAAFLKKINCHALILMSAPENVEDKFFLYHERKSPNILLIEDFSLVPTDC